jgi:hypothetical protein
MSEKIAFTTFDSKSAQKKAQHECAWVQIISVLKDPPKCDTKDQAPWIKMATFGEQRTDKNCLRSNDNILEITGLEGDYDGEEMSPEEAIARLEKAQIGGVVYTSASHTAYKPRWRVLVPLSKPYPKTARNALMARLNGALGGVLSGESFTLSQSYYFGRINGSDYKCLVTFNDPDAGQYIDQLDELDDLAIGKRQSRSNELYGASHGWANTPAWQQAEIAVDRMGRLLCTGDGRRDLMKSYIASRSVKGLQADEIRALCAAFAEKFFDPGDPLDEKNIADIIDYFTSRDAKNNAAGDSIPDLAGDEAQPENDTDAMFPPPFRGVMQDVVEAALAASTKPQPSLCVLSALIGMAASCNGVYGLPSGMRLNLFGCGVAGTGEGKEHPRSIATSLTKAANGALIGKPASGPGLEDNLTSNTGTLIALDEIAHFFAAINSGKAPPHLIDLAGTLLQLFSSSRADYTTRVRATQGGGTASRTLAHPMVSLLGFATPEKLGEAMSVSNIEDGLLGRFLFAFGQSGVVPRRITHSWQMPESVTSSAHAVGLALPMHDLNADPSGGDISILIDPDAEARLSELLVEFDGQRNSAQSAFAKALLTRSCEKCERVAGVLAVWDAPFKPVITLEHVAWAEQLLRASDEALLRFSGEFMHGGQTQADAYRIVRLIKRTLAGDFKPQKRAEREILKTGAAPYSMVMRASKLDKRRFDDATAHLVDLSELQILSSTVPHPNGRSEIRRALILRG